MARQIRFPTLRDLFDTARGNPDLEPERTLHYQLGVERALGSGASRLEVALFQIDADDFIRGRRGKD